MKHSLLFTVTIKQYKHINTQTLIKFMELSCFVKSNFRGYLDMINSTTDEIYIEMHNSFVKRTDEMRIEKNIGV